MKSINYSKDTAMPSKCAPDSKCIVLSSTVTWDLLILEKALNGKIPKFDESEDWQLPIDRRESKLKHFRQNLIQSTKKAYSTDSEPCVQAYEKPCQGEFSASPYVSTFSSVASCYQGLVRHVCDTAFLCVISLSQNASTCENETC